MDFNYFRNLRKLNATQFFEIFMFSAYKNNIKSIYDVKHICWFKPQTLTLPLQRSPLTKKNLIELGRSLLSEFESYLKKLILKIFYLEDFFLFNGNIIDCI